VGGRVLGWLRGVVASASGVARGGALVGETVARDAAPAVMDQPLHPSAAHRWHWPEGLCRGASEPLLRPDQVLTTAKRPDQPLSPDLRVVGAGRLSDQRNTVPLPLGLTPVRRPASVCRNRFRNRLGEAVDGSGREVGRNE
jgi:hypothetical protein